MSLSRTVSVRQTSGNDTVENDIILFSRSTKGIVVGSDFLSVAEKKFQGVIDMDYFKTEMRLILFKVQYVSIKLCRNSVV